MSTVTCSSSSMWESVTRIKSIEAIQAETLDTQSSTKNLNSAQATGPSLRRCLDFKYVVLFGIANTVGTGIFVTTGSAGKYDAGPALFISFLLGGLGCALSGLSYAYFAARVPAAGGAYSYVYASLGEFLAFLVGWCLTLEYGVSSATIARGFSKYFRVLLTETFGLSLADWLEPYYIGGSHVFVIDVFAPILCALVAALCALGVQESSRVSAFFTIMNVSVVLITIVVGATYFMPEHYDDFLPFGLSGVFKGASSVFFSYIGWDAMCVLAEEVENPMKTIPRAIVTCLTIVSALYALMAFVMMGMVDLDSINADAPLSQAFLSLDNKWAAVLVTIGACTCAMNATYGTTAGQPRVWYRMGRDGLLPKQFMVVSMTRKVPTFSIAVTAIMTILLSCFIDFDTLEGMVSAGCLFMQAAVCLGCLAHRSRAGAAPVSSSLVFTFFMLMSISYGFCVQEDSAHWLSYSALVLLGISGALLLVQLAVLFGSLTTAISEGTAPALGLLVNLFIMASAGWEGLLQLGVFFLLCSVGYFWYGRFQSVLNTTDRNTGSSRTESTVNK